MENHVTMVHAPHLRPARPGDAHALLAIESEAFATDRLSPRSIRRLIASPSAAVIVAETAGALVGYALVLFRRGSAVARLYSLAVADTARDQGLGARLVQAAQEAARARNAKMLRLEVRADNGRALALYGGLGFREIGRIPDYYEDGADAIRLESALLSPGERT
ncbi:GNAT family N-acetyltransferase [Kaustia mangrovi]|uniref:GNAT family N-acetyltransferase n=1 Tax=Kaustia mangrovi TaxID=2593653 RepID=A0A7S8C5W7_9HYPH|nr:GNAT family N-acetyltransferase [Kaustia mangrovi]QPC43967.1 GNAT family N-acetyltransferase [Kaustia mangrovi]